MFPCFQIPSLDTGTRTLQGTSKVSTSPASPRIKGEDGGKLHHILDRINPVNGQLPGEHRACWIAFVSLR